MPGGFDPRIVAPDAVSLLGQFPLEPLPIMLVPLDAQQLLDYRDDLRERFRRLALPPEAP